MSKNLSLKTCEKLVREGKTFTRQAAESVDRSTAALKDRLERFQAVRWYIIKNRYPEKDNETTME